MRRKLTKYLLGTLTDQAAPAPAQSTENVVVSAPRFSPEALSLAKLPGPLLALAPGCTERSSDTRKASEA